VPTGVLWEEPGSINVTFTAGSSAAGEPAIALDTISLGSVSGPISTGVGVGGVALSNPSGFNVTLDPIADGFTLAQLNAGQVYLYLGASTIAMAATVLGSASGTFIRNSGASSSGPWSLTGRTGLQGADRSDTGTVQAQTICTSSTLNCTNSQGYTGYTIVRTYLARTAQASGAGSSNCTASDSLGNSFSDSGAVPRIAGNNSDFIDYTVIMTAGVGSQAGPTMQANASALSGSPTQESRAGILLFGTPQTGYNSTVTIGGINGSAELSGGGAGSGSSGAGGGGGAVMGAPVSGLGTQDEQEMTTRYIDDVVTFYAQFVDPSGTATDATGSPTYRVYEETTGTAILNGTMALQDDANTTGFYSAQITASAANGFEANKTYCIRAAATVSAIDQAGIVERFVIRPAIASDVWGATRTQATTLTPTTYGPMLDLLLKYFTNRYVKSGSTVALYNDANTSMGTQGYSVTGEGFDRSKAS
jgi:hypothetical protein